MVRMIQMIRLIQMILCNTLIILREPPPPHLRKHNLWNTLRLDHLLQQYLYDEHENDIRLGETFSDLFFRSTCLKKPRDQGVCLQCAIKVHTIHCDYDQIIMTMTNYG